MVKSGSMNSTVPPIIISNDSAVSPSASFTNSTPSASPTFSPLYQQIKALITQSLQSGEWKSGELIPSEMELANRFILRRFR